MLGELRTSLLAPKTYFELHLRVTGELDGLARYFDARAKRGAAAEREEARRRKSAGLPATANAAAATTAVNAGPPAPTSLAALYDLVQHAGNVLPRLYLLVTVGAARARASKEREEARRRRRKETKKESSTSSSAANDDDDLDDEEPDNEPPAGAILADVAEMCRGVQHPVRGLFLRAFLLQATRDVIPRGEPGARFLLANFAEANKLWVRLGYLTGGGGGAGSAAAASPESSSSLVNSLASVANTTAGAARAAREAERRQLADLVGKNITLLSQLEIDDDEYDREVGGSTSNGNSGSSSSKEGKEGGRRVALYQRLVLPSLLEQVVGCRDAAAQAYLTQAIVQCFPDDHHVATLDALLAALPALAPGARVAGVYGALLDRLARAAVERAEKEKEKEKEKAGSTLSRSSSPVHVLPADGAFGKLAEGAAAIAAAYAGIKVPEIFLQNTIQKRQVSMRRAFPDALDLLLICVESGMSIEHAFRKVSNEIGSSSIPLAEELTLTTAELSFLPDRRLAYENFGLRTGLDSIKQIVTVLIQAERYGTPLGQALRVVSQESRDNRMMEAEKKAAALPPKLTVPMIIFFLPVLFAVIMTPAVIQIMATQ